MIHQNPDWTKTDWIHLFNTIYVILSRSPLTNCITLVTQAIFHFVIHLLVRHIPIMKLLYVILCIISRPGAFSLDYYVSVTCQQCDFTIFTMAKVTQRVKGIKSVQAKKTGPSRELLPITPVLLCKIMAVLTKADDYDSWMLWAVCTTCFFGFLWAGELTVTGDNGFNPSHPLLFSDKAMDSLTAPSIIRST